MGIQQLLPFLSKCTENVNIADFEGWTVAVDAYCWLHKGSYACSEELLLGTPTDKYVQYCMKFVHMLLRHKIKPVLVFDGQKLQAKSDTEQQRHERRRSASIAARRLLLDGNRAEAKKYLGQAISVTSKMAHDVIEACRAIGVDCIVAQYEADAQLAYLSLSGIVHLVISEDSDLLVFGCRRVLFKLDLGGRGELIEQDRLGDVFGADFSFEKFRYMCMLSGCDYLEGVDGVGLSKALRVFKRAKQTDIRKILANLSGYLGRAVTLRPGYIDAFVKANNTFLHQIVFDPLQRCVRPLNERPKDSTASDFPYAGKQLEHSLAFNLALGNLDPVTLKPFDGCTMWSPGNTSDSVWSTSHCLQKTPPRRRRNVESTTVVKTSARAVLESWGSSSSLSLSSSVTAKTSVSCVSENARKRKASPPAMTVSSSSTTLSAKSNYFATATNGTANKSLKMDVSVKETESAIVIEESDSDSDSEVKCLELSSSAPSSSPTIISQTSRFIRRTSVPSSQGVSGKTRSASDFFGILTPPSTQPSKVDSTKSPYFQSTTTRSSLLSNAPSDEKQTAFSKSEENSDEKPLSKRLATRRFLHEQAEKSPSPALVPQSINCNDYGDADVIVVEDHDVKMEEKCHDSVTSKGNDSMQSPEMVPEPPPQSKVIFKEDKVTETAIEAGYKKPASSFANKGGAVRLLLEKFAFKSAAK